MLNKYSMISFVKSNWPTQPRAKVDPNPPNTKAKGSPVNFSNQVEIF